MRRVAVLSGVGGALAGCVLTLLVIALSGGVMERQCGWTRMSDDYYRTGWMPFVSGAPPELTCFERPRLRWP